MNSNKRRKLTEDDSSDHYENIDDNSDYWPESESGDGNEINNENITLIMHLVHCKHYDNE